MPIDGLGQLSQAVGLSLQQDGISLTRTLIQGLQAQIDGAKVTVLEVFGQQRVDQQILPKDPDKRSVRRFDDSGQRTAQYTWCADLDEALASLQPVAVDTGEADTGRLIIPIWGEIGPLRLVVIERLPYNPWARAQILQIVEIYGNLIKLMDSRERDPLTGLLNRQTFATLFELASQRIQADPTLTLILAVLDIDHFKRINDTYGHLYGDEVLIHFARLFERSFRSTDCLFRFGGEEFVVLLHTNQPKTASTGLERFRAVVEAHRFPGVGHITVSGGYTAYRPRILPTTLVDQADRALYHAKENGRNRLVDFADIGDRSVSGSGAIDLF